LEALGYVPPDAGFRDNTVVDMESHSKHVTPSFNPLSTGEAAFAGMSLTQAEQVLGWEPSAGRDVQTELNDIVCFYSSYSYMPICGSYCKFSHYGSVIT